MTLIASAGSAQTPFRFHHLTVNDGLSQGSISAIAQDALGFMWFGTNDGLTRYDGYTLRSFNPDPVDSFSVHDHAITDLLAQGPHTLWIGMRQAGVRRMDLRSFEIQQLGFAEEDALLQPRQVVRLHVDRYDVVWVLLANGLWRYDPTIGVLVPVSFATFQRDWVGVGIDEDSTGALWVAIYDSGLWRIAPDRSGWTRVDIDVRAFPSVKQRRLTNVMVDGRNGLWVGSTNMLVNILDEDHRDVSRPLRVNSVEPFSANYLLLEEGGRIWFTSDERTLSIVDATTGRVDGVQHHAQIPWSISPGNFISGAVDRGGVVWIGSSGHGVNRLATSYRRFPILRIHAPLSFRSVRSILKDRQGNVWIGGYPYESSAGLDRVDQNMGTVRSFSVGSGPWKIPAATVWSILEDPNPAETDLWVGCGNTLTRISPSGRSVRVADLPPPAGGIRGMAFDRSRRLWVGAQRGLHRWDPVARAIVPVHVDTTASSPTAVGLIRTAEILQVVDLPATPGRVWCATVSGMLCYDPASGIVVAFRQSQGPGRLRTSNIQSVTPAREEDAWVATGGAGFARMTLAPDLDSRMPADEDVTFRFYDRLDGLPNDFVYAVLEGNDGAVWISTNRGLARFDPATERFRHHDISDGLQDNEFNSSAFHRAADGELFFGGVVGVNHFYPNRLQDNPNVPSVVITECRLWSDVERRVEGVQFLEEIVAEADDHTITFDFVGLEYTAPERNQYRYQLEGFNASWVESGTNRTATYTNLEPGSYTFRVTASNNDGVWNPTGAAVRLVVRPPMWKTLWFRGFVLLIIAGLWLAGIWHRGRRMAAQNRELERRVREQTAEWEAANSELEAFTYTVSHDLRAPVRAINGYSRMLMEEHAAHLPPDAQRMLTVIAARTKRMGDMIDDLLTFSRAGRQAIVLATIDMVGLVKGVAAELIPSDSRVALTIDDLPPTQGDSALIRQVWINLVSNAVKFSSGTERPSITIGGRTEAKSRIYWIRDNGVGFDMAYQHKLFGVFERLHSQEEFEGTGVGLAIVARIIKRHGGRIWAESQPGQGATFSFELPIDQPASA
jgi:signal transduction histidine kinase/ligand-binding sensor domain-containing protein